MLYMFFAQGFEEVEAIAALDVIRRAGIEIKSVGVGDKIITGSHSIPVVCDITTDEITSFDAVEGVILPGGMPGTLNLFDSAKVHEAVDYCNNNNLLVSAICAAPLILGRKNILNGKSAVCFPGFEEELIGAEISSDFVCTCDNVITAKGMGSAINFGLAIVAYFKGQTFADNLKSSLQCS